MRTTTLAATSSALLFFLSLASAQQRNDVEAKKNASVYDYEEIARAPEKARAKRNPLERDPEAVAAGKNLFEQHCAECHGNSGVGGKKAPSLRAPEVQDSAPGAIFWLMTNGVVRKGMPVWSKLPEPQRWQLVSYVKSLGVKPTDAATTAPKAP